VSPVVTTLTCSSFGNTLTVPSGGQYVYIVTIANTSTTPFDPPALILVNGVPLANITATDVLALGQTFMSCLPSPGCGFIAGPAGTAGTVTFDTGPIPAQTSVSFYITVQAGTGPLQLFNTATIPFGPTSETTTVNVLAPEILTLTPVIPVVVVNTPVPTATSTATATSTVTATGTVVPATNTPVPVATNTAVPTATSTVAAATATATVAPTNTPVPPVPTNTPKPTKKPTATATSVPVVGPGNTSVPPPTVAPVPSVKMPGTGFGGTNHALAHNAAIGRVYRNAHGNVALGITAAPQTGGGNGPLGSSGPILPVILGMIVIGLGVVTRKFAFARR
jgi:hypothetical protein